MSRVLCGKNIGLISHLQANLRISKSGSGENDKESEDDA